MIIRVLIIWVLGFCAAIAQSEPEVTAERAARLLDQAATLLQESEKARDRITALTQTIQAYEAGLAALREGQRQAAIREAALRQAFEARNEQIARLLGMLQVMEASPRPLLLLHPSGPIGTARAGMILSDVTPGLQAEAEALRTQLNELILLRVLQQSSAESLLLGLTGVQRARIDLSHAMAERTELPRRFSADPEKMQALLNSSETLQAFASGLSDLPDDLSNISLPDFTAAKGDLLLPVPVNGTLLHGFGERDAAGVERPGLVIAARPQALVTAPWAATILYRGALLDYGNVIILEPHEGFLMVIAGLGTVYGETGEVIEGGAPLGLMPGSSGDVGTIVQSAAIGTGAEHTESLYIELRQGTDPIDPTDWFTLNKE